MVGLIRTVRSEGARSDQANAIASKPEQRRQRLVTVTARKL
jgi:hypothetical protein